MNPSLNKKILTIAFLAAAALGAFVLSVLIRTFTPLAGGKLAQVLTGDFVVHILPVLVGFFIFLGLQFNKNVLAWADDVVTEIKKVVWPSARDARAMTIVVIVMVMISAVVIWGFDVASAFFVNYLVTLKF